MANRFLNNIRINDAYTLPASDGTSGQVITTDGSGNLTFADTTGGIAESALSLNVTVKNVSGGSLSKGTVVHAAPTAMPPSGNVIEVIAADYDTSTNMPAVAVLNETIANEAQGEAIMFGALSGIDTSSFSAGDELWVGNNGAFTNTKPATAGQLIQKIAVVIKSHASNGLIKVFGAGRTNDVPLPLYIDDTNQRVGIGISSPATDLHIQSASPTITLEDTSATATATISCNDNGTLIYEADPTGAEPSSDHIFKTDGSERMRIDSSGNVTMTAHRENVSVISTNTSAVVGQTYVLTASLTLTLPASPTAGDKIKVSNMSGTTTPVVARNGNNIAGLAEDLTIDVDNLGIQLMYSGATKGWILL